LALTESDASSLANVLGSLGFKVYLVKNASREQMLQALKGFEEKLRGKNALAFFHYGGHGVQAGRLRYIPEVKKRVDFGKRENHFEGFPRHRVGSFF